MKGKNKVIVKVKRIIKMKRKSNEVIDKVKKIRKMKLQYFRFIIGAKPWYSHINTIRQEYEQEIKKISKEELPDLLEEVKFNLESDITKISMPAVTFISNGLFTILFAVATIYWAFRNSLQNSIVSTLIDKTQINTPKFNAEIKDLTQTQITSIFFDILPVGAIFLGVAFFFFAVCNRYIFRYANSKNYLNKYFINFISDELKARDEIKDVVNKENITEVEKESETINDINSASVSKRNKSNLQNENSKHQDRKVRIKA